MIEALVDRHAFPILASKLYLASHSLGAMPRATLQRLQDYARAWAEEGILAWEGEWWQAMEDWCASLERILGAAAGTVVPCVNVTMGFATLASCLDYSQRNRIVMCDLEFTTTQPFWLGQEAHGARLVVLNSPDGVQMPLEALLPAIDAETRLVVLSHAFFRSGALNDVGAVLERCREQGAYLVVDGYQSIGAVPFSVQETPVDFLVGGCHKWLCGGPGGGYLYVRPDLAQTLEPRLTGWFGLAAPFAYEKGAAGLQRHPGVRRFLNGTPNVLGLHAAQEGLAWVERLGISAIREHSLRMTARLMEGARERGLRIRTPDGPGRNGMVCLDFPGAREAQARLQERGVIVDYRPDCGMRVSPHFYNNSSDLDGFWAALDELAIS